MQIEPYTKSLGGTRRTNELPNGLKVVTKAVKELKRCVTINQENLDETFVTEVTTITDIPDNELDDITTDIQKIMEFVNLIQKYIDNTRLFFGYLKTFQLHKSKIESLNIEGTNISDIQKTISTLGTAIGTITEALSPIHKAKQELEKYKKTWNGQQRDEALRGIRSQYFPQELRVFDELRNFDQHVQKLRSIENFEAGMKPIAIASDLGRMETMEPGTSIKESSSHILRLYGIISSIEQTVRISVQIIESSHESNKSNLSGTKNGNGIQSYVDDIKQIPGKLSKLHESVRIYIQLTQILSSVIETLDEMKPKAVSLEKTNYTVGNLRKNVESAISELKFFYFEARHLIYIIHITNILTFGRYIHKLKGHLEKLNSNIGSIRIIEKNLDFSMTKLQEYQKILEEMYTNIEHRTSQLITFVSRICPGTTTNSGSPIIEIKTEYLLACGIIRYMRGIMTKTVKLITTISQVQYSICCTKRKLGCFASSLDTRATWIGEGVREVESSIENVIICFLKCSNKQTTNNTKETTKRILTSGGQLYNDELARPSLRCLENIGCQYNI